MSTISVMTFNLRIDTRDDGDNRWDCRKHCVTDLIRGVSPDILGVQEPRLSQVRYVEEQLPEYIRLGGGREDGKDKGEFTPLHLRTSRFDLLESGMFWMSPTPEVPGSWGWDSAWLRLTTWARVKDKTTGERMLIANTHWDNKGQVARVESAKMTRRWLAEQSLGEPVIFMGDLNSKPDMPQVQMLSDPSLGEPLLVDVYRSVHPVVDKDEATLHHYTGVTEGMPIDYIFCTKHFRPREAEILRTHFAGRYPSDHYPIRAILERA